MQHKKFFFLRLTFITDQNSDFLDKPLKHSRKATYMVTLMDVMWANQRHLKKFVHKTCKEVMMTNSIVLYYPKNFYLSDAIDKKLSIFISSGIKGHWLNKFMNKPSSVYKRGPKQFTVQRLAGFFNVFLIACALSFAIFLLEHFHFRIRNRFRH